MGSILVPIFIVLSAALKLYLYVVFAYVILGWLVQFSVINSRNQFVSMIGRTLEALVEPVLRRIRKIVPAMGNMDLSPVVLGFAIYLIQLYIALTIVPALSS